MSLKSEISRKIDLKKPKRFGYGIFKSRSSKKIDSTTNSNSATRELNFGCYLSKNLIFI